jgi:isocitrate/isopropylmalate dehydrogenase
VLKIGLIPADGIGREVIPVREFLVNIWGQIFLMTVDRIARQLAMQLSLLAQTFREPNSFILTLDGITSLAMA